MFAAILLGTVVTGGGGWWSGFMLIAFFVTASLLSQIRPMAAATTARGNQRDAVQVLANGGIALACSLGYVITQHHLWLIALAGSLAAANADTWSTEIGRSSRSQPRLVTTGKRVPTGTSGAVSGRGLVGAAAGALMIAGIAALAVTRYDGPASSTLVSTLLAVALAGFGGSLLDSVLGATVQERRWCDTCQTQTEQRIHQCGTPTQSCGGLVWVTNDVVNVACVLTGAILASAIGSLVA